MKILIIKLIKLANSLDKKGMHKEADLLDSVIKEATNIAAKNKFIKALKDNDLEAAYDAIVGLSGEDFGMTHDEFRKMTSRLSAINRGGVWPDDVMDDIRKILGVGKNIKIDTSTHNPLTGRPWTSGTIPGTSTGNGILDATQLKFLLKKIYEYYVEPEDKIYIEALLKKIQEGIINGGLDTTTLDPHHQEEIYGLLSNIGESDDELSIGELNILKKIYKDLEYLDEKYANINILKSFIKLANKLDKLCLYKEADLLDSILKEAAGSAAKNSLIKALKDDDVLAARKALVGMSGDDLSLTYKEFTELTNAIQMGDKELMDPNRPKDKPIINMDKAREILGVGKNVKLDPLTHSPLTGQPWSSGPAPKMNAPLYKELLQLKTIIEPHRGRAAGRYHISVLPPEDYIGVDAGLAFRPEDLVKGLEQAGYKRHIPDGETASRSKTVGKDRIVVDVDIAGNAVPTDISVSPMTKENYEAVVNVFSNKSGEQTFDKAVKEFEDYMNQPDPTVP